MATRTWFITGVNSGFGRVTAELLLERGDRVAGTTRKPEEVEDLRRKYADRFWSVRLDLTETTAIQPAVDAAFKHFGSIDVILNNAGYALFGAAEEVSSEQIAHQLQTNLVGSIEVARAALPHLRTQGRGRILQMSSMGGQIAVPGMSIYHASKWGIEGFFEATALDLAPFNVEVTLVEPGSAQTAIFDRGRAVLGTLLPAYEGTPARQTVEIVSGGTYVPPGDAQKMMKAMIDSVEKSPAPKRLALGSDAYGMICEALTSRLAELEDQKEVSTSTDVV